MALHVLLSATALEVSYFNNFANSSKCKGLSPFTGESPSSTADLHLVLNTSCLRKKKIMFSPLSYGRMFSCDNNRRETPGVSSTVLFFLPEINRFLETLSSFCIFEKALFLDPRDSILETQDSRLETRSSNVSSIEAPGSSLEVRVSSVNLLLSGTVVF